MEVLYINIVKMSTFFYIYYKNKFVLHDKLEKKMESNAFLIKAYSFRSNLFSFGCTKANNFLKKKYIYILKRIFKVQTPFHFPRKVEIKRKTDCLCNRMNWTFGSYTRVGWLISPIRFVFGPSSGFGPIRIRTNMA